MQIIVHPHYEAECITQRSFSALRKRCLLPLCRKVFNGMLRLVHKAQVAKLSQLVLKRRIFAAYRNQSGVRKRSTLRRVYTQAGLRCVLLHWISHYKYTYVSQSLLAQYLVNVHNRLRILQPALQTWKTFIERSLPPTSPNLLRAQRGFVDSSDLRERPLNFKIDCKLLRYGFLKWLRALLDRKTEQNSANPARIRCFGL